MVGLMSNIDVNLANRAITLEHLNHLPHDEPPSSTPGPYDEYPSAPDANTFKTAIYKDAVPAHWEELLVGAFGDFRGRYPDIALDGEEVRLWKKYYVKHRCTVGSQHSKNDQITNQRDDTYIWWLEDEQRQYGQVVIFAEVYNWEPVALIRRFKQVRENTDLETTIVGDRMGAIEAIAVRDIGGLIGRIEKRINVKGGKRKRDDNTKMTYIIWSGRDHLYT